MIRTAFLFVIIVVAFTGPPFLFLAASFAYAVRYVAYELLVIAACVDAVYGLYNSFIPYYFLTMFVWVLAMEYLRPRLSLYNTFDEA